MLKRYLEAGEIVGTHGLCGEVRISPWCDTPRFLLQFDRFYLDNGSDSVIPEKMRVQKSILIAKFRGVDSIGDAGRLIKKNLFIDRESVSLPEGSYFEQDLIGMTVLDYDTGAVYGTLSEVGRTGKNDYYVVRRENAPDVLIPAIRDVIRKVDPESGKLLITPLKGLFDDEN